MHTPWFRRTVSSNHRGDASIFSTLSLSLSSSFLCTNRSRWVSALLALPPHRVFSCLRSKFGCWSAGMRRLLNLHGHVDRVSFRSSTRPSCPLPRWKDGRSWSQTRLHRFEQTQAFFGSVPTIGSGGTGASKQIDPFRFWRKPCRNTRCPLRRCTHHGIGVDDHGVSRDHVPAPAGDARTRRRCTCNEEVESMALCSCKEGGNKLTVPWEHKGPWR